MSSAIISPDVAETRQVSTTSRSPVTKEQLAESLNQASEAQRDCAGSILSAHLDAGSSAGEYIAASVAGITIDPTKAVLLAIDAIIDASHDGRSRNVRRQEIKRQVCLSALATVVNIVGLPVGHAFQLVGAKIVSFDLEKGIGVLDLDSISAARQVIADYRKAPCDAKSFRNALLAALGRKSVKTSHTALLDSLRAVLADEQTSDERRRLIYATHPELDPAFIDPSEVSTALNTIGKLTKASQLAAIIKALENDPAMAESVLISLAGE